MNNQEIASIFYEIADILEMQNIAWKPRAYRQAARAIENLSENVADIYKKGGIKLLEEIPGVGEGIAKKIVQYLEKGKINEYERLKKQVPKHINILMKVQGIGPKKVKKLNQLLKISTIKQLEESARQHKIANIPGFGEKSEQEILEGIAMMQKSQERIPLKKAEKTANSIVSQLKPMKEVLQISAAGSLRRKRESVRDIDILVSSKQPEKVIDTFTKLKEVEKVLAKGPTKATVNLKSGVQVDLRVLPPESWGAGLFYFTGSKTYNIEMRKIAIKKGYKLSEYGLFDRQSGKMLAGKTEEEICKKLGVKWIRPEEREI
jgi:DNA polymerase (family 10)